MQYELQVFHDEAHREFRTIKIDGEPWFVLVDVCSVLDYRMKDGSYWHIAQKLDADERKTVAKSIINGDHSPNREGGVNTPGASLICVSESGLYSLILQSGKPGAKAFKKWVTSEVLPSIRRTGVYSVGPTPIAADWQPFHDRITAVWGAVPEGYFSIFKEMAEITAQLISQGMTVDHKTIPDIPVGMAWGKVWATEQYEGCFGPRKSYAHSYPPSFPQARSNPQPAYCYPEDALPVFRRWVRNEYLKNGMPKYLANKSAKGEIAPAVAASFLRALGNEAAARLLR